MPYLTAVAHTTDEDVWKIDNGVGEDEQLTPALRLAGFQVRRGWERPPGRDTNAGAFRRHFRQAHVQRTTAPRSPAREPGEMPDPIEVSLASCAGSPA